MTTAKSLFLLLLKSYTPQELAKELRVNIGTVNRWINTKFIPDFYINDFVRISGLKGEHKNGIEENCQYFTMPEVAKECYHFLQKQLKEYNIKTRNYRYLEPSAGCGSFLSILPEDKRVGMDIDPQPNKRITKKVQNEIKKMDFLSWKPDGRNYVVIGNPPFGRNGKVAYDFIKKSFEFSDIVGFILPPIFNSYGKGSCRNRLAKDGHVCLGTLDIMKDSYFCPDGRDVSVKTIFQVWSKTAPEKYQESKRADISEEIGIYNICVPYKPSRSPSRVHLIGKCDIYIARTFWNKKETILVSEHFGDMPYKDGYGIQITDKKKKREVIRAIKNINWRENAHVSTNGSLSLRKQIIEDQLIRAGVFGDQKTGVYNAIGG